MSSPSGSPSVAVILAVFNEEDHIDACLESLVNQTHRADEIIIADGGSTDRTEELLEIWRRRHVDMIRIIDNPGRHQAAGLTSAARVSESEILVRADGHTVFAPDYIAQSVGTLVANEAVAVGGSQTGSAEGGVAAAIAAAMTSKVASGPAPYRHSDSILAVDTVYLGTFRRSDFLAMGGFRLLPSGAAEDADLYYRWRERGRTVLFNPAIRSQYHPRTSWRQLARQYWKYGVAKADMRMLHGEFPHKRPYLPVALVVALGLGLALGFITGLWWPLLLVTSAWLVALGSVVVTVAGSPTVRLGAAFAAAIMHVGYGGGLLVGLFRGRSRVVSATEEF